MTDQTPPRVVPMDIDAVLANPSGHFATPAEVLGYPGLSRPFRLKLLRQWEHDARLLAEAENEGMAGGEESMLGRVRQALRTLEAEIADAAGEAVRPPPPDPIGALRTYMRAQPLTAVATLFGIGYLLGRIAGARR